MAVRDDVRSLTLQELEQASPHLAYVAGHGLVHAYQGAGGLFVVYTTGSQVFVSTMRDTPMSVQVEDLPSWSSEFAVPCARALAAGAIQAVEQGHLLLISEEDSDWAWDQDVKGAEVTAPQGLLERWFAQVPWGARGDALDITIRLHGIWDDPKTTLTLLLGDEFSPFERLNYRFPEGTLASVHTEAARAGDWSVMESFEAAFHRHLPSAQVFDSAGHPWSAASARAQLEGQANAEMRLQIQLPGPAVFGAALAFQHEGQQWYRLVLVAFPS